MKVRRLIIVLGFLMAVAALVSGAFVSHWQRSQTTKGLPRLVAAEQGYLRDHVSQGQPLPASVTLRDLVSGGYISTNDVTAFDGMEVMFFPTASDNDPQAILVRVRMSDDRQIAVLADGSVQQLEK